MKYLLDTNICIHIIRRKPQALVDRLRGISIRDIGVSAITVAELQFGVHKSRQPAQNQEALAQFLLPLMIMDFNYEAALEYGQIRAFLESAGTLIGALDLLIAAQARSVGAVLITNNTREFSRVPELVVEDWIGD